MTPRDSLRSWRPGGWLARLSVAALAIMVVGGGAATFRALAADPVPGNDAFADAEAVTHTLSGTTRGATSDDAETAAGIADADRRVVWYSWTAPASGWTYLTPASATDAAPETKVFLGETLEDLDRVDRPATGTGSRGVSIPAVADNTYKIAVIGEGAGAGFALAINQPAVGGPLNDEPANAVDVGATVARASTTGVDQEIAIDTLGGATAAPDEAATGGQAAEHSVWYSWTAAHTGGTMRFAAEPVYGADGPIRVAVYTADEPAEATPLGVGHLTPAPGGATGGPVAVVAGTTYLISVDGPESFYRLVVTSTDVASNEDTTPPVVACTDPPTAWTGADVVTVECTATDDESGLALDDDARFTLSAEVTDDHESDDVTIPGRQVCDQAGNCATVGPFDGIQVDRRAPVVDCTPVDATWVTEATVECTATDEGSGLADPGDAQQTFRAAVSANTEDQLMIDGADICDEVGNCTTVGPFGPVSVDNRAPVVRCDEPTAGPHRAQVSVECTATDEGAGLANAAQAEFSLTTDVAPGTASDRAATDSVEVCDLAGNCTTAGPYRDLVVDLAPPSVTCTPDDGKPVDAWRGGPFTFTCAIADIGTGLVSGTPDEVTLTAHLADGEASDSVVARSDDLTEVCDRAGACVPVGPIEGLRIDRQAPEVSCAPGGDGWHRSSVSVLCPVDDGDGAGIDGPATVTLRATAPDGAEGTYATGTAEVCDTVGNCTTAGPVTGLHLDDRAPRIVCDEPAATYRVEARIGCRATDGGSGLADPADASFVLVTSVGTGSRDAAARTDRREVCDRAGLCTVAGPYEVSVDLTGEPGEGPTMDLPTRMTVLSTYDPIGPTAVPFEVPEVPGADLVRCQARPGTMFALGWSTVVCEAVDTGGVSLGSFPVVVKALPELAPDAPATSGGAWRAVGVGFAPGSSVTVEVAGRTIGRATASASGRVAEPVEIPARVQAGDHQLVLRGSDAAGDPLLVVGPVAVLAAEPGTDPPTVVPPGAPELPETGPSVPADPGAAPHAPDLGDLQMLPEEPEDPEVPGSTLPLPGDPAGPDGPDGPDGPGGPGGPDGPGGHGPDGSPGAGNGTDHPDAPTVTPGLSMTRLPRTGADIAAWTVLGLVLVAVGGVLVTLRRRRRSPAD